MCLGKTNKRINALEKEVRILQTQLHKLTTVAKYPPHWNPFVKTTKYSVVSAIKSIMKYLNIEFQFIESESDRWEIVEKADESEEE